MSIPRPEHPNPQWERENWRNLNGSWEFEFDFGCSAVERRLWEKEAFDREILVPFCPESRLSSIGYTDFIPGAAYRRPFTLSARELAGRVLLHFGAVDYEAQVYVNGRLAGSHKGGYTSFSFDITGLAREGENTLFVAVRDDVRSGLQPKGKQADKFYSNACDYTRTTGIWQTVWLEFVPRAHVQSARYYPDPENGRVTIAGLVQGQGTLRAAALWEGKPVGERSLSVKGGHFSLELPLEETHLWQPGQGGLYTLLLDFEEDHVKSYFGLRDVRFQGRKFFLNGKSLFMRLVLDQGFYPEGVYTAPTEEDMVKDIALSFAAGFNGARLHEKVFEPRFLYHCDRMGYLAWGEYPNWGLDHAGALSVETYVNEWSEAVERDFNHPAIIGWCPFNETWDYHEEREANALLSSVYKLTKRLDPTRPCIDSSGNFRVLSEVYDIHDYDQNTDTFQARWDGFTALAKEMGSLSGDDPFFEGLPWGEHGKAPFFNQPYDGQPVFISEYGGIRWVENTVEGWGYGAAPATAEEFFARYKGLTEALLQNPEICGFCYTQLYDIEQEINGLYTYGRQEKFPISLIREINQQPAAIEGSWEGRDA